MDIYTAEGYPDIRKMTSCRAPFIYAWGGRGCGKTYSALQYYTYENPQLFMYVRRTQTQIDLVSTPALQPYKRMNRDHNDSIEPVPEKNGMFAFRRLIPDENDKRIATGPTFGYMCALSTFHNLRAGFDGSDVRVIIYDEFIPQDEERELKNEYTVLMHLYETVNRNRELDGEDPVLLLCLANANTPEGNIFLAGELMGKAIEMQKRSKNFSLIESRGIALFNMFDSPISAKKESTALYRATRGTAFYDMAVKNQFALDTSVPLRSLPLREFLPVVNIGELGIWKHKSEGYIYVTRKQDPSVRKFILAEYDLKIFKQRFSWLYLRYLDEQILFDSEVCSLLFVKYLEMA